jgi:hypothetical protein
MGDAEDYERAGGGLKKNAVKLLSTQEQNGRSTIRKVPLAARILSSSRDRNRQKARRPIDIAESRLCIASGSSFAEFTNGLSEGIACSSLDKSFAEGSVWEGA